jgi:hypothetical protein
MRVLWIVPEADARRVCEDERTTDPDHIRWGLHWTARLLPGEQGVYWDFVPDDGRFAAVLAELGVTVLACATSPAVVHLDRELAAAGTRGGMW